MKRTLLCLVLFLAAVADASAQNVIRPGRYLIKFRNKANSSFTIANPSAYLSARSIARRTRYGIAIDSTDLPVTPAYLDSLRAIPTVTVLNPSKWLNSASIRISDTSAANVTAVLNKINSFPFVLSSSGLAQRAEAFVSAARQPKLETADGSASQQRVSAVEADFFNYGSSFNQIHVHNAEFLHNIGLRGQGMVLGMLDAGFQNYLTVQAFDSIRLNGQVLGTYDFVAKETSVNEDHPHGEQCLSIIAGNLPGQYIGTAPKASFYLFRTEDASTEFPIEEHNWVCGAERVDSAGGDVISSSLGYYDFDPPLQSLSHPFSDMTGNITMAAIGADLAAKKGVLVVNAAGNEGNNSWGRIITPADGDSVLAVGAVNVAGVPGSFTSRGPSADGQVKPDVASVGVNTVIANQSNTISSGNGTSYACPNMAGIATCLWQGFQEFDNMKIINALRRAGSRANNPNDTVGYGIPDAKKALLNLTKDFSTANVTMGTCKTTIGWTSKDIANLRYEIERKAPGETAFTKVSERYGTGSIFANHSYTSTDSLMNVQAGTITYRIRQVIDTAGATLTADYIDTVTINLAASCITTAVPTVSAPGVEILLQPNPTHGAVILKVTTPAAFSDLQVRITDAQGKLVRRSTHSKGSGTTLIRIETTGLASGKYFVSVSGKGQLLGTRELVKL
ncbi:MAG: family serine peptidase [Flaviaesturariibacter sp.]|nr:family serine peptidase [Flaviaesturariibacter sp.]